MAEEILRAKIFLSYPPRNTQAVQQLYEFLDDVGFEVFFEKEDFLDEQEGENNLGIAIGHSHFFLACTSGKSSLNSIQNLFSKELPQRTKLFQNEIAIAKEIAGKNSAADLYLIVCRLDDSSLPAALNEYPREDLYESDGLEKLVGRIKTAMKHLGIPFVPRIRSRPRTDLSLFEAARLIRIKGFFHKERNNQVKGFGAVYNFNLLEGDKIFIEQTTGLMWQRYVSTRFMEVKEAKEHIKHLNDTKFAGYGDWRLPTLDEAMTLMQKLVDKDFFLDPRIHDRDRWILTADEAEGGSWNVNYTYGICRPGHPVDGICVRAVRPG